MNFVKHQVGGGTVGYEIWHGSGWVNPTHRLENLLVAMQAVECRLQHEAVPMFTISMPERALQRNTQEENTATDIYII